jgi:hypothetical protein
MPILNGRIGKWILAISEFDLRYELATVVKGQVMADFITHHHKEAETVNLAPWTLFFDGSSCKQGGGIGIVIILPRGASFESSQFLQIIKLNMKLLSKDFNFLMK